MSLPWVRQVQVDFAKKQAVVTIQGEHDAKALLKALQSARFNGKVLKDTRPPGTDTSSTVQQQDPQVELAARRTVIFQLEGFT